MSSRGQNLEWCSLYLQQKINDMEEEDGLTEIKVFLSSCILPNNNVHLSINQLWQHLETSHHSEGKQRCRLTRQLFISQRCVESNCPSFCSSSGCWAFVETQVSRINMENKEITVIIFIIRLIFTGSFRDTVNNVGGSWEGL